MSLNAPQGFVSDIHSQTIIRFDGKDAAKFLHGLCTNDIVKVATGHGCEAFMLDAKGRIISHITIGLHNAVLYLRTVPGLAERLIQHFDHYHFREQVTFTDLSSQWNELIVLDASTALLQQVLGSKTELLSQPFTINSYVLDDAELVVQCLPIFGKNVVHFFGVGATLEKLRQRFLQSSLLDITAAQLNNRRIETGWPLPEVDYDDKTLPQELDRDSSAISFNKGCYLGQETVARLDALGQVQKKLVGFLLPTIEVTLPWTLAINDKEVATVTSISTDQTTNGAIGIGMARRAVFATGSKIPTPHGEVAIASLPFQTMSR